jgi:transcriptional regulator with PAS, ATPase and Fis domain
LDEVGELPASIQAKLLRFLQDGSCRRVGDTKTNSFDVRIISATNRNLEEAVNDGLFREDLFFRINVIPIYIPSLRERKEDVALLANHFLQKFCSENSRNVNGISANSLKKMMEYNWPGNVRELQNVVEYSLHLSEDNGLIEEENLPAKVSGSKPNDKLTLKFTSIEDYIKQSIVSLQNDYNEERIAEILGISRKNLWEKRKRWGISRPISN